jgi:hypothetical protein
VLSFMHYISNLIEMHRVRKEARKAEKEALQAA